MEGNTRVRQVRSLGEYSGPSFWSKRMQSTWCIIACGRDNSIYTPIRLNCISVVIQIDITSSWVTRPFHLCVQTLLQHQSSKGEKGDEYSDLTIPSPERTLLLPKDEWSRLEVQAPVCVHGTHHCLVRSTFPGAY